MIYIEIEDACCTNKFIHIFVLIITITNIILLYGYIVFQHEIMWFLTFFVEKPLQDVKQGKYPNINLKLLDVRDNVVSNVCV